MSYEECKLHPGENDTNGCAKCAAEYVEKRLLALDNFLADWFGHTGEREATICFLEKFKEEGFEVVDSEEGIRLGDVAK